MARHPRSRLDHPLAVAPAIPVLVTTRDVVLPIVAFAFAGWVIVLLLLLRPPRRTNRTRPGWLPVMTGPSAREVHERPTDRGHRWMREEIRLQVIPPGDLPDFDDVVGHRLAVAALDDLAAPVLTAGRRTYRRPWNAILLHGETGSGRTTLVRALAGEHRVPLLTVHLRDLARSPTHSAVAAVFAHARERAPCVLFIEGLDQLLTADADGDTATPRRAVNDLASRLRRLPRTEAVVVIGSATSSRHPPRLLLASGFDRHIAVGAPDRAERERIIRRELVLHGATFKGDIADVLRMTDGIPAGDLRTLVAAAIRSARQDLATADGPVVLTLRDLRAGLLLANASTFDPRTVDAGVSRRLRGFARQLGDPERTAGLALFGEDGSGKTTIARWLADSAGRDVTWMTGTDLSALTDGDFEAVVDAACARAPVLVVLDGLDDVGEHTLPLGVKPKHLAAAIERLLDTDGVAVVLTARERHRLSNVVDDELVEALWVPRPSFHDRVRIVRQMFAEVHIADTTPEEVAAHLHGLSRRDVVNVCRRALRTAARSQRTTAVGQDLRIAADDIEALT